MNCSPPGSSVHEMFQARILEWVVIPFSRGSSQPRDRTWASCIASRFFTLWATREAQHSNYLSTTPMKNSDKILCPVQKWETSVPFYKSPSPPAAPGSAPHGVIIEWIDFLTITILCDLRVTVTFLRTLVKVLRIDAGNTGGWLTKNPACTDRKTSSGNAKWCQIYIFGLLIFYHCFSWFLWTDNGCFAEVFLHPFWLPACAPQDVTWPEGMPVVWGLSFFTPLILAVATL